MTYALSEDGSTQESCKWYDHEDDMRAMSKLIKKACCLRYMVRARSPAISGINTFSAARCRSEKATITFAPFDRKKLA